MRVMKQLRPLVSSNWFPFLFLLSTPASAQVVKIEAFDIDTGKRFGNEAVPVVFFYDKTQARPNQRNAVQLTTDANGENSFGAALFRESAGARQIAALTKFMACAGGLGSISQCSKSACLRPRKELGLVQLTLLLGCETEPR
jgi:hypothetical protein